jgi:hypothetical protein
MLGRAKYDVFFILKIINNCKKMVRQDAPYKRGVDGIELFC